MEVHKSLPGKFPQQNVSCYSTCLEICHVLSDLRKVWLRRSTTLLYKIQTSFAKKKNQRIKNMNTSVKWNILISSYFA